MEYPSFSRRPQNLNGALPLGIHHASTSDGTANPLLSQPSSAPVRTLILPFNLQSVSANGVYATIECLMCFLCALRRMVGSRAFNEVVSRPGSGWLGARWAIAPRVCSIQPTFVAAPGSSTTSHGGIKKHTTSRCAIAAAASIAHAPSSVCGGGHKLRTWQRAPHAVP